MHSTMPAARPIIVLLSAMITMLVIISVARAQESVYNASFDQNKETIPVNVLVGQSRVINFDGPIGRFSISNPEIAEAVLVAPDQVVVNGKGYGQINFIAWEQGGKRFLVFDVFVRANLSLIDAQIRALYPKDDIRLSQANGSVVLSGNVADGTRLGQIESVVQAAGFKTVNLLRSPVQDAVQVQLQIRVAEVNRNRARDLGISTAYQGSPGVGGFISGGGPGSLSGATGGVLTSSLGSALNVFVMGGNTLNMIRAMQTSGALRALAEPNMIAMDGQTASFLAGGEFPVPVVQAGGGGSAAVTIEFKQYGVRLNFKPIVIDEDHIRLELEPEVSTIDFANGVRFNGFVIPALRTRRAKTGIELRDGQSFALAGLLDNNETRSLSKIPVLGDIPILGNLFKSTSFQKNETELMFIVTAQIVKPVSPDDLPQLRGIDGLKKGSPLGVEPKGSGLQGQSGFSTGQKTDAPAVTTPTTQGSGATVIPAAPDQKTAVPAAAPKVAVATPADGAVAAPAP